MLMPELPEVEMARMLVQYRLRERQVITVEVLDDKMMANCSADLLKAALQGGTVGEARRHGKNLLVGVGSTHLYVHLGMSGEISVVSEGVHTPHERLRLGIGDGFLVLDYPRRFGRFGLYRSIRDLIADKGLGPDALTVPGEEFASRMEGRKGSIKPLLLDQGIIAGVGNLYADEALFQERLHPAVKVNALSRNELIGLGERVRNVLETSIAVRTDLSRLPDGHLLRDRREGALCPRCGTVLGCMRIGGRTTVLCPGCQSER